MKPTIQGVSLAEINARAFIIPLHCSLLLIIERECSPKAKRICGSKKKKKKKEEKKKEKKERKRKEKNT